MLWLKDEFKRPGLPFSVGLHAAVLVASVVSFSSPKKFEDVSEAISVEMVDENALREITRGEQAAKQPQPAPRVDRVDDKKEQNAPGEAKRQVNADNTPKAQEATAKEERKDIAAVVPPPLPIPRPQPPKPVEPPKVAAVAKPPKPAETTDEEEEAEEVTRQAAKKREEQKKLEDARRAEDAKKREDTRKADEARKQDEQRREQQAEAARREELKKVADAKAADDRKKTEDVKKAQDARKAEDAKKADDAKKVQEAAKKAADEKKKREAEQDAKNQATADAARRALLASREVPSNSGNTGQQLQRNPAAGTPAATGQKLNPSDRAALAGMLADQIRTCWSVPVSGKPNILPQVRVSLNADGSLNGAPVLVNSSGDPNFRALADSGMRAIRQCSPFRIPQRFAPTYNDWRTIAVQLNPDD